MHGQCDCPRQDICDWETAKHGINHTDRDCWFSREVNMPNIHENDRLYCFEPDMMIDDFV